MTGVIGDDVVRKLEERVTRSEAAIGHVQERLATALQSFAGSISVLQLAQSRQENKLDHIVELQNEAKNMASSIQRVFDSIGEMNEANKERWDRHNLEVENRWSAHKIETEREAARIALAASQRLEDWTANRADVGKNIAVLTKTVSSWTFAGGLLVAVFAVIIMPLSILTYNKDIEAGIKDREIIKAQAVLDRTVVLANSDRLRALELNAAKDPNFRPAGVK